MIVLKRKEDGHLTSTPLERDGFCRHASKPTKVSVIIPVYNAEPYLGETLSSIRGQTLRDIEIICVNDASSDASLSILEQHLDEDPRITIIDSTINLGTGAAINLGLLIAGGSYVQLVGNDDLLKPFALERLFAFCENNNVDFCQYAIETINGDPSDPFLKDRQKVKDAYHRVEAPYPILPGFKLLMLAVQRGEYRMTNGPEIVRKSLLDDHQIRNLEGYHHEDMYYTYRILLSAQRATILDEPLYEYRIHRGSLEARKFDRILTSEGLKALLVSASLMATETPDELYFSHEFKPVVHGEIERYYALAAKRYCQLPNHERAAISPPDNKILTGILAALEGAASDRDRLQAENERLRSSYSYKLGHALLSGPYRLKKIFHRRAK